MLAGQSQLINHSFLRATFFLTLDHTGRRGKENRRVGDGVAGQGSGAVLRPAHEEWQAFIQVHSQCPKRGRRKVMLRDIPTRMKSYPCTWSNISTMPSTCPQGMLIGWPLERNHLETTRAKTQRKIAYLCSGKGQKVDNSRKSNQCHLHKGASLIFIFFCYLQVQEKTVSDLGSSINSQGSN